MPRRWFWSLLDVAAVVCLGQATMLSQRSSVMLPLERAAVLELERADEDLRGFGTRIYEAGDLIVVQTRLPGQDSRSLSVRVEEGWITLGSQRIPVPAGAQENSFRLSRLGDEVRLLFVKCADTEVR